MFAWKPGNKHKVFWRAWGSASALWIVLALALVPTSREITPLLPWANPATKSAAPLLTDCGHVIEPVAAAVCVTSQEMAHNRAQHRREQRFRDALWSLGILIGPPLAGLFFALVAYASSPGIGSQRDPAHRSG